MREWHEQTSTNATIKNRNENWNGDIPEINEIKFSEKKKKDNRKEIPKRSNNNKTIMDQKIYKLN